MAQDNFLSPQEFKKNQLIAVKLIVSILIIISSILFLYKMIYLSNNYDSVSINNPSPTMSLKSENDYDSRYNINTTQPPVPTKVPYPARIVKNNQDGSITDIIEFKKNPDTKIIQWQNYLFYNDGSGFKSYDLTTGETKLIYDFINKEDDSTVEIFSSLIYKNVLYFNYHAYMIASPMYYINLPYEGSVNKINIPEKYQGKWGGYNGMSEINGKLYLIEMLGDSCVWMSRYQEIDPDSKNLIPNTFESHGGCSKGEEIIGFDKTGNPIVAYHEDDKRFESLTQNNELKDQSGNIIGIVPNPELGTFHYIARLNRDNPQQKTYIVTESRMPDYITRVTYFEDENIIVMTGGNIAIYHLDTGQYKFLTKTPTDWTFNASIENFNETSLCMTASYNQSGKDWNYADINISDGTITYRDKPCGKHPKFDYYSSELIEQLKLLNLPSEYRIIYE